MEFQRIKILPTQIAAQIAAGEVVERPASVVKELLENSIDAGAQSVLIDVHQGGTSFIRVRDDGHGVHKDDLSLALTPHATSKIRQLHDLQCSTSLGFRGEALASISSVAQLTLMSKHLHSKYAWQLQREHNKVEVTPIAHPQGTTVEIRQLFYNTPVRRKFLKSERTEWQHIADVVKRVALVVKHLGIRLQHNDRQIMHFPPATDIHGVRLRLRKLLGGSFADAALTIDVEHLDLQLHGWVLPPEQSRAHADIHYFFVNGRMVKDRLLNHAVCSAFGETLAVGRYPGYVLYLTCAASEVDVNVHPTKHEVRFQQARLVHDFVQNSLQQLLGASLSKTKAAIAATPLVFKENAGITVNAIGESVIPYKAEQLSTSRVFANACHLLGGRFILATSAVDLFVIDALKARRWLLRKFISSAIAADGLRAQPLLLPMTVKLSVQAVEALLAQSSLWRRFGIDLDQVAPNTVIVRALPQCLRDVDVESLLQALQPLRKQVEVIDCLVAHAIGVEELSLTEMQQLIADLSTFSLTHLAQEKLVKHFTHDKLITLFA